LYTESCGLGKGETTDEENGEDEERRVILRKTEVCDPFEK
jgi:hypothetical protein